MAKQNKSKGFGLYILITVLCILLVGLIIKLQLNNSIISQLQASLTEKAHVQLPANAVRISACVPHMGEHWGEPDKLQHGPLYVVNNGEVIGLEYMFQPSEIPGENLAKMSPQAFVDYSKSHDLSLAKYIQDYKLGFNVPETIIKSFDIEWSQPHAGFVIPHYDIHLYFVTQEELNQICPDAKIEDNFTQEFMETYKKFNIPVPGQ